jgi:predicted acylesterase/phospholipase RssA
MKKLYKEILEASERSRQSKHKVRMLLSSDDLQPYLQYAFDHFCRNLDRPFDFVQASFANNPIPSNFGGNILKLGIDIMELWKDKLDAPSIFKELSFMVASCIMIDSARHRTLGPAEKVFGAYYDHCDRALEDFCDRHWPCEYVHPNTEGRCVNVKAGHTKGHQLSSGKVLAVGDYQSGFTPQGYKEFFRIAVLWNLTKLLERLNNATLGQPHLELEKAAEIHRSMVLNPFYQHLQGRNHFVSHTACYCCLIATPEHALPCGHVLCTPCVQIFGKARGRCFVEMTECPLHYDHIGGQFTTRWPLFIKPPGAGIRILSLDGGGVRGIIELVILQQIQNNLGRLLPIQVFFDLIIGTSTGGIIALGLGANGWQVAKCISVFESLCKQAFTKRKDYGIPGLEQVISSWNHSRYETAPIEDALQAAFGHDTDLFAGLKEDLDDSTVRRLTKVAVSTATTAGTAALLANYNRMDDQEGAPYQFHRSEKSRAEIKTWQAARATSAAPWYFKPFAHEPTGQVYQDGALHYNCPVEMAMREQKLIWPDRAEACPDVVLSLGTGYNPNSRPRNPKKPRGGFVAGVKFFTRTIQNVVYATLNSEQTWLNFKNRSNLTGQLKQRYVRLNLTMDQHPPELDCVDSIGDLKHRTERQFPQDGEAIKHISNRLLATSFYFNLDLEDTARVEDGVIRGYLECRFAPGSQEVKALGEILRKRQRLAYNQKYIRHNPYFVIQDSRRDSLPRQIVLAPDVVDRMIDEGIFAMEKCSIEYGDSRAEIEILFCFADQPGDISLYPVSGFPRYFADEIDKGEIENDTVLKRHPLTDFSTPIEARRSTPDTQLCRLLCDLEILRGKEEDLQLSGGRFLELCGPSKVIRQLRIY